MSHRWKGAAGNCLPVGRALSETPGAGQVPDWEGSEVWARGTASLAHREQPRESQGCPSERWFWLIFLLLFQVMGTWGARARGADAATSETRPLDSGLSQALSLSLVADIGQAAVGWIQSSGACTHTQDRCAQRSR